MRWVHELDWACQKGGSSKHPFIPITISSLLSICYVGRRRLTGRQQTTDSAEPEHPPIFTPNPTQPQKTPSMQSPSREQLQLHIIIQQPHLLPGLERRQSNIRTPIAPESIAQRAVPATPHLALDGEVDLIEQLVGAEFHRVEGFVGGGALRAVLGFEALFHAAGAVFAGAAALAGFGAAFEGCGWVS